MMNASFVFLCDANARPPGGEEFGVGGDFNHRPSPTTPQLRTFVDQVDMWLPATFSKCVAQGSEVGTYYWSQDASP
eukprot:4599550-Karenia_brevis.AAC.1